jgi:hypothetical protein
MERRLTTDHQPGQVLDVRVGFADVCIKAGLGGDDLIDVIIDAGDGDPGLARQIKLVDHVQYTATGSETFSTLHGRLPKGVEVTLRLPPDTAVVVRTVGSITVYGRLSDSELRAPYIDAAEICNCDLSGEAINVDSLDGGGGHSTLRAEGDITVGHLRGRAKLETVYGDVTVRHLGGTVELTTSHGSHQVHGTPSTPLTVLARCDISGADVISVAA